MEVVFREPLPALLPFVPVLRGGGEEAVVRRAVQMLRREVRLDELEPLLAFFAGFVLEPMVVQQIVRWDMAVLRESPWYQEILREGVEQGRQQEAQRQLVRVLQRRFEIISDDLQIGLATLNVEQLESLIDVALTVDSFEEFVRHLSSS